MTFWTFVLVECIQEVYELSSGVVTEIGQLTCLMKVKLAVSVPGLVDLIIQKYSYKLSILASLMILRIVLSEN
jgi:hypothetical protein